MVLSTKTSGSGPAGAVAQLRRWSPTRWLVAVICSVAVSLAVGLPTDVIPNPVFGRPVPVTWWSYPVLVLTAVLGGLLVATYLQDSGGGLERFPDEFDGDSERTARTGGAAGLLSVFAVGCPVCNHLVVLAVGVTGARQWFEPLQPVLAAMSLTLLAYALVARLTSAASCPLPGSRRSALSGRTERSDL